MDLGRTKSSSIFFILTPRNRSILFCSFPTIVSCILWLAFCEFLVVENCFSSQETNVSLPKRQLALDYFAQAVQMRTSLESKPKRLRTPAEYLNVIIKFRSVYYASPTSSKADDALIAAAELYQLMANDFRDPQSYRQASK